jgi:predicted nucleic acid-binding protein
MAVLVDTGILLRLLERSDPQHGIVRQAVSLLRRRGSRLVISPQNSAEFWNVCTRPSAAWGGFGLSAIEADRRLRVIERLFPVLPDLPTAYAQWRNLVVAQSVAGIQTHDARLVAFMMSHGITEILTLNPVDFARYAGVTAITPASILSISP